MSPPPGGLCRLLIPTRTKGQDSEDASGSDSNSSRLRQIRARLSECSTDYAQQVSTLLYHFTISSGSEFEDDTLSRRPSVDPSEHPEQPERSSPGPYEDFPEPGLALPGNFTTAHTRSCADFSGQSHGRGCWCVVVEEVSKPPDSWLLPKGELDSRAHHILDNPTPANLALRDSFGNTILHVLASHEDYHDGLLSLAVVALSLSLVLINTGDQTFLHLLHPSWFASLTPISPLGQLLAISKTRPPRPCTSPTTTSAISLLRPLSGPPPLDPRHSPSTLQPPPRHPPLGLQYNPPLPSLPPLSSYPPPPTPTSSQIPKPSRPNARPPPPATYPLRLQKAPSPPGSATSPRSSQPSTQTRTRTTA